MSGDGGRNILMFLGSMMVIATFWLAVLGFQNGSPLQVMASVVTLALAIFCFRAYFISLKKARGSSPDQ
jgi:quinol-cytochrome oxidoreductase complex cytochrome b subunit